MAKDLRRRGGERPIVHESVGCAPGTGPSADSLRQSPMRDVDVQRLVGGHFEKRHLTIAGERVRFVEAPDSRFDGVDAAGPRGAGQPPRRRQTAGACRAGDSSSPALAVLFHFLALPPDGLPAPLATPPQPTSHPVVPLCKTAQSRAAFVAECADYLQSAVLNGTARIPRAAQTEVVSNETKPQSLSNVKPGDVLVSHPTAVREHEISIVPNAPHETSPTHDAAIREGRSEADAIGVDAWLTEDQTHVVKIASNRAADK